MARLLVVQSLPQSQTTQAEAGARLGAPLTSEAKQEVWAGGLSLTSEARSWPSPSPGKTKQGVHS